MFSFPDCIPCVKRIYLTNNNTNVNEVEQNNCKRMLFWCCFGKCWMLAYKILVCEVCIFGKKMIAACKILCQSPSQWLVEASVDLTKYTTRLFHGPWHDPLGKHIVISICADPFGKWNSLTLLFLHVSQILHRCKSDVNKQDFEIKWNLTVKVHQSPKQ